MPALITTVVLAVAFALFATQNTTGVTLNFGSYVTRNIPLYLVVLLPLLLGLLLALLFHVAKDLSSSLTISEEKGRVKKLKKELVEVTKTAHKLEVENAKLKTQLGEPEDENSI